MSDNAYAAPGTVNDAVSLLARNPGSHVLAGGQNLLIEPSRSRLAGALLVDLRKLRELSGIESGNSGMRIGATTTIGAIAASEAIRKAFPALAEAAALVGDAQVRNRATLGGAVSEANPASDLIPVLLILDAALDIAGAKSRSMAAGQFFTGPSQTALSAAELITAVRIPALAPFTGTAYEKMKQPATLYALCGAAASITLSAEGVVTACRAALTGAIEYPVRVPDVEAAVIGSKPGDSLFETAASRVNGHLSYRGDFYASSTYRAHLARVLTKRALHRAAERARQL